MTDKNNDTEDKAMEENEIIYDLDEAKAFITAKFAEQGDFIQIMPQEDIDRLIGRTQELNETFMDEKGVNDGETYDDDEAYAYLTEKLGEEFPEQKMYIGRFVDDYMEYDEAYLESIGAIAWDD